jgi:hypothetical protein
LFILKIILRILDTALDPLLLLAALFAWQAHLAALANQISPDAYFICAVVLFTGWWIKQGRK